MGAANILVPISLALFVIATAACFATLSPRRALLWSMLGGWLFLPHFDDRYKVLFLGAKATFVGAVVLACAIVFDLGRWSRQRPRWIDLPVLVLCLAPFATAMSNGLGLKEALSSTLDACLLWGAPYALGRVYLGQPRAIRSYAIALVAAACVYAPLCLWEIRMSPQLQMDIYGFRPWSFDQAFRAGGFRPSVFMQHGLAVGMFMAVGTLIAFWLWRTRAVASVGGVRTVWIWILLGGTTLACKSTGSILLLGVGLAVLEGTYRLHNRGLLLALAIAAPIYCTVRIVGWQVTQRIGAIAVRVTDEDRAASLLFRMQNEDRLIQKAMTQPYLGWGRFGRSFIYSEEGRLMTVTDGLWIIIVGVGGLVALVALWMVLAGPSLGLLRSISGRSWADPRVAPAAALVVSILLWVIDELLNSMVSPLFPTIAGALASLLVFVRRARTSSRAPRRRPIQQSAGLVGSVRSSAP